ncbi:MAG: UDP-N-acetylglucosamine--N-acetylmuramyl-(pentapeptide) pyrophosphoryl-undecaprenol N-acetylglucosamine transferase [Gemmatimonas sp.]|jgi:UDP-N-acetylglucosamine--N-acetylmuramyl-(pentapeptide) pyrophosphoryl-undecaprenol N-acetylglucosamine transferase|uniref:UDP-N-acetylglucosamine--N-acetylmuramyl- (pentapeptide) pyrophosphoryl-undecaprenol N-acetylglucosamine transferase n=1 Tax=Gemmatimonas sp. TaxID=1962908 RepID=UPI00391FB692|nr:glycosyltransferase [Gemmatimonadota bacterium]
MTAVRVLFAGGGTGGHLYPGLAIARALVRLSPSMRPHFIGARRGIEKDVLPGSGFPYTLLDLHPLYRQRPWHNWKTLVGGVSAWRAISALAADQRPAAVVGTGGYAAGVALAWARAHGVPTMLHEPDSHPGLTTRAFAGGARALYLGFPEAAARLAAAPDASVHAFGCPIDPPPSPPPSPAEARAHWGFPTNAFVVLIVGGSQGARALNEATAEWVAQGLPPGVVLIWATGRQQAAAYLDRDGDRVRVRPYLSPIADAYAAADLAVARAGAMSIAELCAWGIPSVLVPLPTAAQDHQTHNARATAAAGAAVHLPQADLTAAHLDALVRSLQADAPHRQALRDAALARAHPDAAERIARSLLDTLGRR